MNDVNGRHETTAGLPSPEIWRRLGTRRAKLQGWCSALSFGGAVVSGLAGIVVLGISDASTGRAASLEGVVGSILLIAVIPVLMLGAHMLDCLERGAERGQLLTHESVRTTYLVGEDYARSHDVD